jgi:TorA maturation chaperone TorD
MDENRVIAEAGSWLCFARVFSPPRDAEACADLATVLPEDLRGAFSDSGVRSDDVLTALDSLAEPVTPEAAFQAYSSLFLVPPAPAPLNLGTYLDGRRAGASIADLDACCRHLGVEPAIKDQPDHLAVVLELVALLKVRELRAFRAGEPEAAAESRQTSRYLVDKYLLPALPRVIEAAQRASQERALPPFYWRLADLLRQRLAAEVASP